MNKFERYEHNLDGAYNAVLEGKEAELLKREMLEDMVLTDRETFERLCFEYADRSLNEPLSFGFLDWAVDQLLREEEPEHDHAWEERPSNKEYWNWDDDDKTCSTLNEHTLSRMEWDGRRGL